MLCGLKCLTKLLIIIAVNGTDIVKAKLFKIVRLVYKALGKIFNLRCYYLYRRTNNGDFIENTSCIILKFSVIIRHTNSRKIGSKSPLIRRDRHAVFIEDDHHREICLAVVKRLVHHATGICSVAGNAYCMAFSACKSVCLCKAKSR